MKWMRSNDLLTWNQCLLVCLFVCLFVFTPTKNNIKTWWLLCFYIFAIFQYGNDDNQKEVLNEEMIYLHHHINFIWRNWWQMVIMVIVVCFAPKNEFQVYIRSILIRINDKLIHLGLAVCVCVHKPEVVIIRMLMSIHTHQRCVVLRL